MSTLESLMTSPMYSSALLAGLAVVTMCGVLSVFVVVKRLGFVGQGVSHSAFGGVGVASLLAVMLPAAFAPHDGGGGMGELLQFGVIVVFCIATALGMGLMSNRRTLPADTSIGMFLVGSMALGAVLVHVSREMARSRGQSSLVQSWESILFGSIFLVTRDEMYGGWVIAALVLGVAWWFRRPLLFWVLDEESSSAFGVPAGAMKGTLMVMLAVAVVVAMKLAGVVLATALLVMPGAIALRLTQRLWPSVAISVMAGIIGLIGGLLLSLRLDWPPGPSVVLTLTVIFVLASCIVWMSTRWARPALVGEPVR